MGQRGLIKHFQSNRPSPSPTQPTKTPAEYHLTSPNIPSISTTDLTNIQKNQRNSPLDLALNRAIPRSKSSLDVEFSLQGTGYGVVNSHSHQKSLIQSTNKTTEKQVNKNTGIKQAQIQEKHILD